MRIRFRIFGLGLVTVLALSACSAPADPATTEPSLAAAEVVPPPATRTADPFEELPKITPPGEPRGADWTCAYRPTYNYDWHDDVLCSNGAERQRPYLREWDSYVTEYEIMESAREYEGQLNAAE